jgi:hypothetical protein
MTPREARFLMNVPTVKSRGLARLLRLGGAACGCGAGGRRRVVVRWRRSRAARDVVVCARGCPVVACRRHTQTATADGVGETLKRHLPHYYTSLTLASRPPRLSRSAMLILAGVATPSPR